MEGNARGLDDTIKVTVTLRRKAFEALNRMAERYSLSPETALALLVNFAAYNERMNLEDLMAGYIGSMPFVKERDSRNDYHHGLRYLGGSKWARVKANGEVLVYDEEDPKDAWFFESRKGMAKTLSDMAPYMFGGLFADDGDDD